MSETPKQILTELRNRFQGLYGSRLAEMVLYGSQARGTGPLLRNIRRDGLPV